MIYLDDLGPETIDKEYKIVTINPIEVDNNDARRFLINGKWYFNNSIIKTIKNYLNIYLSKYIATYSHIKSRLNYGYFYLGVADNGIIHGIPYQGEIPVELINRS